jgi:hypothetical protein
MILNIYIAYMDTNANAPVAVVITKFDHPVHSMISCLATVASNIFNYTSTIDDLTQRHATMNALLKTLYVIGNNFIDLYKNNNLLYTCIQGWSGEYNVLTGLYYAYSSVDKADGLIKRLAPVFDMGDMDKSSLNEYILTHICNPETMPSEDDISKFTTALPNLFKFKVAQKTARNNKPITQFNENGSGNGASGNGNGSGPAKRRSWGYNN